MPSFLCIQEIVLLYSPAHCGILWRQASGFLFRYLLQLFQLLGLQIYSWGAYVGGRKWGVGFAWLLEHLVSEVTHLGRECEAVYEHYFG